MTEAKEGEKECSCDCISMGDVNKMPVHSKCGKIVPKDKFYLLMSPSASYMCSTKHDLEDLEKENKELRTRVADLKLLNGGQVAFSEGLQKANAELQNRLSTMQAINDANGMDMIGLTMRISTLLKASEGMEKALEHCRHRPHEHNPVGDFTVTKCEVIDSALADFRAVKERK